MVEPASRANEHYTMNQVTFDSTLGGRRQPQRNIIHVSFDLVQMLLAEVLDGVAHRVRLKYADPVV